MVDLFGNNIKQLQHRKSKYTKLKTDLLEKFNNYEYIDYVKPPKIGSVFNYVDLFAGGGGMSLGIQNAGFNKLVDVEILPFAHETLKKNFPYAKHYLGDIAEFNPDDYINLAHEPVHLLVGGPPCQGFSIAGKRNPKDQRNFLFKEYIRVLKKLNPMFFIMENVPGIITLDGGSFYEEIMLDFKKSGYDVTVKIMEVADYGVPQLRTRAIFIGNRVGVLNPYPKKILSPHEYKSIDSAIDKFKNIAADPKINHVWTKHSAKFEERISQVKPGESLYETFKDAYKRQRIGEPSMTIKENHGGTHLHYTLNRCISTREMAAIQTFPDDYFFCGSHKQGFIQVGNAVPPLFAEYLGNAVLQKLMQLK